MAAAIVPIVAPLAVEVIQLIAGLVHSKAPTVEQQYGAATGPVKFADVFGAVMLAMQNAAAAGQISKQLPSDEAVQAIIQAVISSMKLGGLLSGTPAPVAGSQPITLKAGQSITVTVAA